MRVVLKGMPAGKRAEVKGIAKVVLDSTRALQEIKEGDILVTSMTNPDFVPVMKIARAIICDKGGITCHAAIVSRELGIPCIVGTEDGTKKLITGQKYIIDARTGVVYSEKEEEEKVERKIEIGKMDYENLRVCFNCGGIYPKTDPDCPYCLSRNPKRRKKDE